MDIERTFSVGYTPPDAKMDTKREQEVFRSFFNGCLKVTADLWEFSKEVLVEVYGDDITLTADAATIVMLQSLHEFQMDPNVDTIKNPHFVGRIARFFVYRDITQKENKAVITWRGKTAAINIVGLDNSPVN